MTAIPIGGMLVGPYDGIPILVNLILNGSSSFTLIPKDGLKIILVSGYFFSRTDVLKAGLSKNFILAIMACPLHPQ